MVRRFFRSISQIYSILASVNSLDVSRDERYNEFRRRLRFIGFARILHVSLGTMYEHAPRIIFEGYLKHNDGRLTRYTIGFAIDSQGKFYIGATKRRRNRPSIDYIFTYDMPDLPWDIAGHIESYL